MLAQDVIVNDVGQQDKKTRQGQRPAAAREVGERGIGSCAQLYNDALLSEWILMSNYSADDFGHRFIWPDMELEISAHF